MRISYCWEASGNSWSVNQETTEEPRAASHCWLKDDVPMLLARHSSVQPKST